VHTNNHAQNKSTKSFRYASLHPQYGRATPLTPLAAHTLPAPPQIQRTAQQKLLARKKLLACKSAANTLSEYWRHLNHSPCGEYQIFRA